MNTFDDPAIAFWRKAIVGSECIYVREQTTGLKAHVYGHAKCIIAGPVVVSSETAAEVLGGAAKYLTIDITEDQLEDVLQLVTEIKGRHEFLGWSETGD